MTAWSRLEFPPVAGPVRFGYTIGKRNARRAVDRNLIKRVLREAARSALAALQARVLAQHGPPGIGPTHGVDLVFRLKAPLGESAAARPAQGAGGLRAGARRAGVKKAPAGDSGTQRAADAPARSRLAARSPQLRLSLRGEADALLLALHAALVPEALAAAKASVSS